MEQERNHTVAEALDRITRVHNGAAALVGAQPVPAVCGETALLEDLLDRVERAERLLALSFGAAPEEPACPNHAVKHDAEPACPSWHADHDVERPARVYALGDSEDYVDHEDLWRLAPLSSPPARECGVYVL